MPYVPRKHYHLAPIRKSQDQTVREITALLIRATPAERRRIKSLLDQIDAAERRQAERQLDELLRN